MLVQVCLARRTEVPDLHDLQWKAMCIAFHRINEKCQVVSL